MKKKILCFLLSVCLMPSLAACKEEIKEVPVAATAPVETTKAVPETTEALPETTVSGLLEAMLSGGKYELGGTGCPFTAWLDVETEEGESLTVVLATDSCGVWMSEGYYYSYGSDSQPLYDLFGVTLEFGKFVE